MIIMNLSVAAVIDGLSSARKDNDGVIKKDEVNELINLWAEYDPKATGWIEVSDLVFLLYELPEPLGYANKIENLMINKNGKPEDRSLDVTNIIAKAQSEKETLRARLQMGHTSMLHRSDMVDPEDENTSEDGRVKRLKTMFEIEEARKKDMVVNEARGIMLRKVEAIKILDDFNIPYYENNKVHFKDICRKLINNTFESNNMQVKVGKKLKKRIQRGWQKKYNLKKHKRIRIHIQKIMAAKILLRWIMIYKKRKREKEMATEREKETNKEASNVDRNVTNNIFDELDELRADEEDKQNELSRTPKEFSAKNDMFYTPKFPIVGRVDSKISEDCKNFIESNPEYFESIKREVQPSIENQKTTIKTKRQHNKKKSSIIEEPDAGSQSFAGAAVGNFFSTDLKEKNIIKYRNNKQSLNPKKMEQIMRSSAVFNKAAELKLHDEDEQSIYGGTEYHPDSNDLLD